MKQTLQKIWLLGNLSLCWLAIASPVKAQIAGDNTLGTTVNSSPSSPCMSGSCSITGGTTRGSNLFHSFDQFSIPSGVTANFVNNNPTVQNIISRVTGNLPSDINGTIAASGTYRNFNLFLINPNGIYFGQNANLLLHGSFTASTAKSVIFANGTQFIAEAAAPAPLLAISAPIGLQFGNSTASIQVQSSSLSVPKGNTLALVGGGINITGSKLAANNGEIVLASMGANSQVSFIPTPTGLILGYKGEPNFQDINLSQSAKVIAAGGNIQVLAKNAILTEGSSLAIPPSNTESGGNLNIFTSNSVQLIGTSSGLFSRTTDNKNAGNINITTNKLMIANGGGIYSSTFGNSKGGEITINAGESVELTGNFSRNIVTGVFSQILNSANNKEGGTIRIASPQITLTNEAIISSSTGNGGFAGNLIFNSDRLTLQNGAKISSKSFGTGTPGNINVTANTVWLDNLSELSNNTVSAKGGDINFQNLNILSLSNGSQISASTLNGKGGNINITAANSTSLNNSSILVVAYGSGNAGNINIGTNLLNLQNVSQIAANNTGTGNGGSLAITAGTIFLDNQSKLSAESRSGLGGNIKLWISNDLNLNNGSKISISTITGEGGFITISAANLINLNNGSNLSAEATGRGFAGSLRIATEQLILQNRSSLNVNNTGLGSAGNLEITARSIFLDRQSELKAATASGEGGNIQLKVRDSIILRHNSNILADAMKNGNGGNITINAGGFILGVPSENSDIVANAYEGRGGNINATAIAIFTFQQMGRNRTDKSDFKASSTLGINGTVEISVRDNIRIEPLSVERLPGEVAQGCAIGGNSSPTQKSKSQFIVTEKGGMLPNPGAILNNNSSQVPFINTGFEQSSDRASILPNPTNSPPSEIVEAIGWERDINGKIALVPQNATDQNLSWWLSTCYERQTSP
jgi:filamentous hemagglutinin family protein